MTYKTILTTLMIVAGAGAVSAQTTDDGSDNSEQTSSQQTATETGQEKAENCTDLITTFQEDVRMTSEKQNEIKGDIDKLAKSDPLIVNMSDGTYVSLRGEGELSEPFESWFANEQVLRKKEAALGEATKFNEAQDETNCLAVLKAAASQ